MKHTLALLLALPLAAPAFAQSGITFYGLIDQALEYTNDKANAYYGGTPPQLVPGQSGVKITNGAMLGSRLGFRGSEDLGGGLKAVFAIEHRFQADTGTPNSSAFWNAQAWAGLEGNWGRVSMGRQYSPMFWLFLSLDTTGMRFYQSWDRFISVFRYDNSLEYRTPSLGGLTFSAIYSFGENLTPSGSTTPPYDTSQLRSNDKWGASVRWERGPLLVGGAYQNYAPAFVVPGYRVSNAREYGVGLGYRFGSTAQLGLAYAVQNNNLNASYERQDITQYLMSLSFAVPGGRTYLNYMYVDPEGGKASHRVGLSYEWMLSNRTSVYTSLGLDQNYSWGVSGTGANASQALGDRQYLALGVRHSF